MKVVNNSLCSIRISEKRRLLLCAILTITVSLLYRFSYFRVLNAHSLNESRVIFGIIIVFSIIVNMRILEQCSEIWMLMLSTMIPIGIYTSLAYAGFFPIRFVIGTLITVAIEVVYIKSKKLDLIEGKKKCVWRCVAGVCLVIYLICGASILGGKIISERESYPFPSPDKKTIRDNIHVLSCLDDEKWTKIGDDRKMIVLQKIADIEADQLGLSPAPEVITKNIYAHGCYDDETNRILLCKDALNEDNGYNSLLTLAHECYHAWQYRIIRDYDGLDEKTKNLYPYNRVPQYEKEFNNYISSALDYKYYSSQLVESDADSYAQNEYDRIVEAIKTHFNKLNSTGK